MLGELVKLIEEVVKKIREVAPTISAQPLLFAPQKPEVGARLSCCFENVADKVKKDGGDILFGWYFLLKDHLQHGPYLVAGHHAVWCSPHQDLVDVTPYDENPNLAPLTFSGNTLFLVDAEAFPVLKNQILAPLPNQYFALGDGKGINEYVFELGEAEKADLQRTYEGDYDPARVMWVAPAEKS